MHDLDAILQSELAAMAREASGDGKSLSFGSIHQLLVASGVYSQEFSKADASSLFFAVLRQHQGALRSGLQDGKGGRGQQMSSGRLPLTAVSLVLRRIARRIFATIPETRRTAAVRAHLCTECSLMVTMVALASRSILWRHQSAQLTASRGERTPAVEVSMAPNAFHQVASEVTT